MNRAVSPRSNPQSDSSKPKFTILSILSGIGFGLSWYLSHHFYLLRSGGGSHFKSLCNYSSSLNCDVVAASRSAELIFGLPLSSFSAGWFLALMIISLIGLQKFWKREATRAALALSLVGVLFGVVYLFIMKFQLHTLCLFCLGIDLVTIAALFLVLSLKPEGFSEHPLDRSKWKTFAMVLVGSLFISVAGFHAADSSTYSSGEALQEASSVLSSPPVAVQSEGDFPTLGPKDAPITVVEFSDFQCPFCRIGAMQVNSLLYRFPGKVKIVFRNYPLDQKCNSAIQSSMHPYACEAAKASICAHQQGKFDAAYDSLFENQAAFGQNGKTITDLMKAIGLDELKYQACMASPETELKVQKDIAEVKTFKFAGTPTFFVNGHQIDGAVSVPVWNTIVEQLLNR